MNTIAAVALKHRGMIALEKALAFGPVHILKGNKPTVVVLRESDYNALLPQKSAQNSKDAAFNWIMDYKPSGTLSKEEIDIRITEECDFLEVK